MTISQRNTIGFTAIGSILSALGVGAAFSALLYVISGISFSGGQPTPVLEITQVYFVYALISGAAIAVLFGAAQGARYLFGFGDKVNAGISHVLATLAGICLGTGLMFWGTIAVGLIDSSDTAALIGFLVSPFISGFITYYAWTGLAKLTSLQATEEGRSLSLRLANTSTLATLVPFIYFAVLLLRSSL